MLEKFRKTHKNRYEYPFETRSLRGSDRIEIVCPVHGSFYQLARNHVKHGCKKCAMAELHKKQFCTTEECVAKFVRKHGTTYDYSRVQYADQMTKVEIVCPIHGSFRMAPKHHWNGWHCPPCGRERKREKLRKTTASFIKDARKLWGDRWNYDRVDYQDGKTPVTITCLDHGDFSIPARHHLGGQGCPRCSSGRSELEELWLDEKNVPAAQRHHRVDFPDGKYLFPDGLDEDNKIVYLFMGDYWHGNPKIYPPEKMHPTFKKLFRQVYEETMADVRRYQELGYTTIVEWESDFTPIDRLNREVILEPIRSIIPDAASAYSFLEALFPEKVLTCPYCGSSQVWRSGKRGLHYCMSASCKETHGSKKSFTVRLGTMFHSSQVPLHKWLYGIYLVKSSNRKLTNTVLSIRIGVGKGAAATIAAELQKRRNQAFVARIFIELKNLTGKLDHTIGK